VSVCAVKIKHQLPPDRIDHRTVRAERQPRARTHHARFLQRVGQTRHSLHRCNRLPYRCGWNIVFAQGAQSSQFAQILERVRLALGD
jgi:hypothetical protein